MPSALLDAEVPKPFVESRYLSSSINQSLVATRPHWMRQRIDIESHGVAFLAPGRAGFESAAVCAHHVDFMIIGVDFFFH